MNHPRLTPVAVLVLALLREGDMHPYEMMRLLRQRREDRLVAVTNGTLYHTVGRLERDGLVEQVGTDRDGNRPERTTYTLTRSGQHAVLAWVRRELPRTDRTPEFRIALSEAHNLPRDEVVELLTARRTELGEQLDLARPTLLCHDENSFRRQFLVELEWSAAVTEAEIAWLDSLLLRLNSGAMPWGIETYAASVDSTVGSTVDSRTTELLREATVR